jgi:hypothetical protein
MNDLVGRKFGLLTVTEYSGKPGLKHRWICQCECGNSKDIQENHLTSNITKSCGCLKRRKGKDSPFFKGVGELPLDVFGIIKRSAKGGGKFNRKGKEFNVTIEYLWKLFLNQNRKCALTGLEIGFDGTGQENKYRETNKRTASLDRIDSSKGYIEGNVQWVHKDINIMKNDLDTSTFLIYCSLVYENQSGRNRQNTVHGP